MSANLDCLQRTKSSMSWSKSKSLILLLLSVLFLLICGNSFAADDYPYKYYCSGCHQIYNGDDHDDFSEWKFFYRQCTDFVAWCLNSRNGVGFTNWYGGVRWGNAKDWRAAAESLGITCNNTPAVGSIACWTGGSWGHVAWVSAVDGNTVTIEEYNYSYSCAYGTRTISSSDPSCFIHIKDIQTDVSFDVNFTVDGVGKEYIYGIGDISVYVGGQIMTYQDKQHSSATNSYSDFCRSVPGGQAYDVCLRITNPDYWCAGTIEGTAHGTTSGATTVKFDIRSSKPASSIPNGDYMIVAAGYSDKSAFQYLDIQGTAVPAADHDNVALCGPYSSLNPPSYEIWTVTYDPSKGFYKIKQKGTDMCLDIAGDGATAGANVQVLKDNTQYNTHYWIIEQNGSDGYRIRARNSGQLLDVAGGSIANGTNIQQWPQNGSDAQKWLFIPYNPTQPINDGEYVILYTETQAHEVDLPGDTGDLANNTQIQIWKDTAVSKYNTYAFTKLSNGYYKIKHVESGKCLDVTGGLPNYKSKVAIHDDNGSLAQQWAVLKDGSGYSIISRCNGYALDLPNGTTTNGTGIEVYPRLNNAHQRWSLVKAKYTVSYDMNGGTGSISDQTKFYKSELTLSSTIPTKAYHSFLGWSASADATTATYSAGGTFTTDVDTTLYAVWKSNNYTLSYNGNGGSPVPAAQNSTGAAVTIPEDVVPIRPHYHFHGWAESATATAATYAPGDTYSKGVSTTLYAVWERSYDNIFVLPAFLTEIDDEAFLDTNADVIVIPATVTTIGENAFGDVVIYGYAGTAAETYADNHRLTFIPLTGNWVLESEMPSGAHVTDNKWTYTLTTTNTTTSTETSLEGWSLAGYDWQQTGTGTWKYASYPSGFDTGNSLYSKYNKSALAEGETITGNTKRVVNKGSTFITYIYWHWAFVDALNEGDTNSNVLVEDAKKYNVLTGNVYRDYIYFDAFEDTVDHGTWGPGTSGQINVDPMRYAWRDNRWDVSHWWWIFEVRQQTYTDYQKLFTYVKDESELLESTTEVIAGDGISNIQHWVKYGF